MRTRHFSPANRLMALVLCLLVALPMYSTRAAFDGDALEVSGDLIQILLPATGFGLTLGMQDRQGMVDFAESFGSSFLTMRTFKSYVQRVRPSFSSESWPSGHTTASFSGASFIHQRYLREQSPLLQALPYSLAAYVGWTRVQSTKHHIGDIVAGAIVGSVPTYLFTAPIGERGSLRPVASEDGYGFEVVVEWSGTAYPDGRAPSAALGDRVPRGPFGYDLARTTLFDDALEPLNQTRSTSRIGLASEVTALPNDAGGWVDVRPRGQWAFLPKHEVMLEIPYREADLTAFGEFKRGLGDIRSSYKYEIHRADSPDAGFQGAAVSIEGIFPTGQTKRATTADIMLVAPKVAAAFGGAEQQLGFFPALTYLHSFGSTGARAVADPMLYIPEQPNVANEREIRSLLLELPFVYRINSRFWLGASPNLSHEFVRGDTTLMINGNVGFKISDAASFVFDYSEHVAGEEILEARMRLGVAWVF